MYEYSIIGSLLLFVRNFSVYVCNYLYLVAILQKTTNNLKGLTSEENQQSRDFEQYTILVIRTKNTIHYVRTYVLEGFPASSETKMTDAWVFHSTVR